MPKKAQNPIDKIDKNSSDFQEMVRLLAIYTETKNQLDQLENTSNQDYLAIVDDILNDYSKLQETLTNAEAALELVARMHPEWFSEDRKSIKTPYGAVQFRSSTRLVSENEEVSILLIEHRAEKDPAFRADDYLRVKKELNLEALEKLEDAELAALRVKRVRESSFSVKPGQIKLGQAVKEREAVAKQNSNPVAAAA